jgi:hypothetical protein
MSNKPSQANSYSSTDVISAHIRAALNTGAKDAFDSALRQFLGLVKWLWGIAILITTLEDSSSPFGHESSQCVRLKHSMVVG